MADQQQQMRNLFHMAYPGVKCRIERETVASPSFLYQDGPPLEEVQRLLGSFHLPVVRAINANLLGFTAWAFLRKYVTTMDMVLPGGFHQGYVVPDVHCSFEEKEQATQYAQSLSEQSMQKIVEAYLADRKNDKEAFRMPQQICWLCNTPFSGNRKFCSDCYELDAALQPFIDRDDSHLLRMIVDAKEDGAYNAAQDAPRFLEGQELVQRATSFAKEGVENDYHVETYEQSLYVYAFQIGYQNGIDTVLHERIQSDAHLANLELEARADGYEDAEWDEHGGHVFLTGETLLEKARQRAEGGIGEGWLDKDEIRYYLYGYPRGYQDFVRLILSEDEGAEVRS